VEDRYACFEAGMDGFLIKPLDREKACRSACRPGRVATHRGLSFYSRRSATVSTT